MTRATSYRSPLFIRTMFSRYRLFQLLLSSTFSEGMALISASASGCWMMERIPMAWLLAVGIFSSSPPTGILNT